MKRYLLNKPSTGPRGVDKHSPDAKLRHSLSNASKNVPITRDALVERNQSEDEADVTTGWHAIEFLLWGQDLSLDGLGNRPVSDYTEAMHAERRGEYLRVVTDLLVEDLRSLVKAWEPWEPRESGGESYRRRFLAQPPEQAIEGMLTGLATLSGFELAGERMGVPLDSGDQEDEHSCFSNMTHLDIAANVQGIREAYFGRELILVVPDGRMTLRNHVQWERAAGRWRDGASVAAFLRRGDPGLADRLEENLFRVDELAHAIQPPIDRILASDPGSPGRETMERLVESLYQQAELFQQAGEVLGVEVRIAGE